MDDYLAMTTVHGMTASPGQGLPLRAVTPPPPPQTSILQRQSLRIPKKFAFTDEDACKNVQAPMQNTIPDVLLEMFRAGAYIPMLMFLVENMELIRLDQGVKTHKGLGVRVVEAANFCDEKSLILLYMPKLTPIPQMHGNLYAARFAAPWHGTPIPRCVTGP